MAARARHGGREGERAEANADNYEEVRTRGFGIGALLGLEVFVLDFLSLFAEYRLGIDLRRADVELRVDGELSEGRFRDHALGVGLGNNGSIGVVVYVRPLGVLVSADD